MTNVIDFDGETRLDINPDSVLDAAKGLQQVWVLGMTDEGKLYMAGSSGDTALFNWILDRAKFQLMCGDED